MEQWNTPIPIPPARRASVHACVGQAVPQREPTARSTTSTLNSIMRMGARWWSLFSVFAVIFIGAWMPVRSISRVCATACQRISGPSSPILPIMLPMNPRRLTATCAGILSRSFSMMSIWVFTASMNTWIASNSNSSPMITAQASFMVAYGSRCNGPMWPCSVNSSRSMPKTRNGTLSMLNTPI